MRRALDLSPIRHLMTDTAGRPARQIAASQAHGMAMIRMRGAPVVAMTAGAVAGGGLVGRQADQGAGGGVMTVGAGAMGGVCRADQGVVVAA